MAEDWWRTAAIYQVYLRSFADGNGDGVGDLAGLRSRLDYLADLDVDAIWLNPWYPSPMADGGYDIADYRDIDPVFGTLTEAEAFIQEAHARGIRTIIDVVPNHASVHHEWFVKALDEGPGSPHRKRFWFRPGQGPDGDRPPNDWRSIFGGPAWTRVADGEWYLHLFAPEQPDFNWTDPVVRKEFLDILRFWFDRGADGIRIDSAAVLIKDPDAAPDGRHPYIDRDGVHEIYREWRRIADSYGGRALIGEVWLPDAERFARYLRPDELHTAFNFEFLACPWEGRALREVIEGTLRTHRPLEAAPTWVLSNHDVTRPVTRYGRTDTSFEHADRRHGEATDLSLGTRRARAAALLALGLPGSAYIYQGEELGLWEVDDLPDDVLHDPIWRRSGFVDRGRDGCRVPIPWSGTAPPYGYSTGAPWLPQPSSWRALTVEAESADPGSMLSLYRSALRLRRSLPASLELSWLDLGPDVLAFSRGAGFCCAVNLGSSVVRLPPSATVLLASGPLAADGLAAGGLAAGGLAAGGLAADTTVWFAESG